MDDEFDRMLKGALSPGKREEDRAFVARVSAAVRLDEQVRASSSWRWAQSPPPWCGSDRLKR